MPSNKIFISYRRGLDDDSAGRVFDRMANVFGEDKLFRDVDSSRELVGLDFHDILNQRVSDCSAFVAIIGPEWINGIERLKSENDFVRIEIEAALSREDIRVVPVLIGTLDMPKPDQLPESLQPLTRRGAIRLSNEGYSGAIEMLIGILAEATATEVAVEADAKSDGAVTEAAVEEEAASEFAPDDARLAEASEDDPPEALTDEQAELPAPEDDPKSTARTPVAVAMSAKNASRLPGLRAFTAVVILGVMGFWGFAVADLFGKTERIQGHLSALSTSGKVSLSRQAPSLPPSTYLDATRDGIIAALSTDIESGVTTVLTAANTVTVRVSGGGIFASGSDEINPEYLKTFDRIARVLNAETGNVIVVGHTDNVPIRSARFASNGVLSLARARAVSQRMAQSFDDPRRLSAEGWADQAPIASNTTTEGRAQNRRIEIMLVGSGGRNAL